MRETDARELADRLDEEADELEHRSDEVEQHTKDAAQEWAQKRSDPKVPGAPPEDDDDDDSNDDDDEGDGWDDPEDEDEDGAEKQASRVRLRLAGRAAQIALVVDQDHAEQLGVVERLERE